MRLYSMCYRLLTRFLQSSGVRRRACLHPKVRAHTIPRSATSIWTIHTTTWIRIHACPACCLAPVSRSPMPSQVADPPSGAFFRTTRAATECMDSVLPFCAAQKPLVCYGLTYAYNNCKTIGFTGRKQTRGHCGDAGITENMPKMRVFGLGVLLPISCKKRWCGSCMHRSSHKTSRLLSRKTASCSPCTALRCMCCSGGRPRGQICRLERYRRSRHGREAAGGALVNAGAYCWMD